MAYEYLDGLADPKSWKPAECTLEVSRHKVWGRDALKMHIPIDYQSGESKHPIGWPRMYAAVISAEQKWGVHDYFEFQVLSDSSTAKLPVDPLMLQLFDEQGARRSHIKLNDLKHGEWITVRIPLTALGATDKVPRVGFNISEANYQDKESVTFHLGGFRLACHREVSILDYNLSTPAIFNDAGVLPIEFTASGPQDKLAGGIEFRLRLGATGNSAQWSRPLVRGRQVLYLELPSKPLNPGLYTFSMHCGGAELAQAGEIMVTSSPWR